MNLESDAVRHFMGDVGFAVAEGAGEMADHISVELAFLAELTRREAEARAAGDAELANEAADIARRFVAAHPDAWAGAFADRSRRERKLHSTRRWRGCSVNFSIGGLQRWSRPEQFLCAVETPSARAEASGGRDMRIFGLVGRSGSGKTSLMVGLLPALRRRGFTVSTIKHAHHGFDLDHPGKDLFRHREAGAKEVMLVADARWALMHEIDGAATAAAR